MRSYRRRKDGSQIRREKERHGKRERKRESEREIQQERQSDAEPRRRLDVLCAPRKRCLWILNSLWNSHSGSKMARTRRILRLNDVLSEFCMPLRPRAAHPPYGRLYALYVLRSLFSLSTSRATARQETYESLHVLFSFTLATENAVPFRNSGFPFIDNTLYIYVGCFLKTFSKNEISDLSLCLQPFHYQK